MPNKSSGQTQAGSTGVKFQDVDSATGLKIADASERTKRAEEYEKKTNGIFNFIMQQCLASSNTVADGAAIIQYGEPFASKLGDLADQNDKVRRGIDLITSGTENPYLALVAAALPLAAQILRNHENTELTTERYIRIPFTKRQFRIPFKLKIRISPRVRAMTAPPENLMMATFMNPEIAAALEKMQIPVAWQPPENKTNGRKQ